MSGIDADGPPRVALLLGGFDPPDRSTAVAEGRRPANDVEMLTRELGAAVYDFGWLAAGRSRTHRSLARWATRTGAWSAALAIASVREVRRADVVYVSGEDVGVVAAALARWWPGRRPVFVLRVERHRYGRTRARRRVHRAAMRFALRAVDVAICRTAAVAARLREDAPPSTLVTVHGQEIDVGYFDPEAPVHGDVAVPIASDDVPYLFTAGLERRDVDTLVAAVDGLETLSGEPVRLVIAAGSPWSKDSFRTTRDLPPNAIVGSFGPAEMRELYRRATAVVLSVHPTERACGMNVIGEAWAMGRPVVATATEGVSEYVTDGATGLLVPPGDVAALRAVLERVLASAALRCEIGRAGQAHVRHALSLGGFVSTVGAIVSSVVAGDR